jgi:hypothetical protein
MNVRTRPASLTTIAGAGLVAVGLVGAGVHFSGGSGADSTIRLAATETAAVSVTCPDVAGKVGAVPAKAQAGVSQELANLERQIANVNARLAREPGQAANQLNDLAGKRGAVIDRIILDFTRLGAAEPAGLRGLVNCSLSKGAGANAGGAAAAAPTTAAAVPAGNAAAPAGNAGKAQTVKCPAVQGALPAIPATAAAEVTRNLALLDTQIAEADARLAKIFIKPEGGPAFIQNAILGPLEDKRFAVLNRIATAIGRTAARPDNLAVLAPCTLNG